MCSFLFLYLYLPFASFCLLSSSDSFISCIDVFSESYPSIGVRQSPPSLYWQKQWLLYNIIYHPGAFVQHPVSYGGLQPVRGWHSIWQASADAKWQWHKEGAHHAGPDRAVFHREEAWLDLKAQPKIRLQHRSWHLFGLVLMFVISLDRKHFFSWTDMTAECQIEMCFVVLTRFFAFVLLESYICEVSFCTLMI